MNETRFRFGALALLAGILICQVVQVVRTPLVRVRGEVEVTNSSLEVEIQNRSLDVEVQNTTLDVEVTNRKPIAVNVQR